MKLATRIFFSYLIIFAVCFSFPVNWMAENLRTRYMEGVEDPIVDTSRVLAELAAMEMEEGRFDPDTWARRFNRIHDREFSAKIYELEKTSVDLRVYITDATGRVLFDSRYPENAGRDFTAWRDVRLTLEGKYGARASLADGDDPSSSVLFTAAPILVEGEIAGVLTVGKPTTNILYFIEQAKPQLLHTGLAALVSMLILSLLTSIWITRPIQRLTRYARAVGNGDRPQFPRLDNSEIGEMGAAFEGMREALEGKRYVSRYVQNLTHEIKSPLSAIRGAAELLEEDMPAERRERFYQNIRNEALRIQQIIDRMLDLAALENESRLEKAEPVSLRATVQTVAESLGPVASRKGVSLSPVFPAEIKDSGLSRGSEKSEEKSKSPETDASRITGDPLLIFQAVSNLVQNAIDFSPQGGVVSLILATDENGVSIRVQDRGPGIPDYAREKIFEKFFSLQRPDTGKKSTGLGLNFVREIAALHEGEVRLENRASGGCEAFLVFGRRKSSFK